MSDRDEASVPAACLVGLHLNEGWTVAAALPKKSSSGGAFSYFYEARNGDRLGFVKAIDFTEAFEPGVDTIVALNRLTAAFELERDILLLCAEKRLSRVVIAMSHGYVQVPKFDAVTGRVYYLIFEKADGDVRRQADMTNRLDTLWSLRALRDVCLGLEQVHRHHIAHQDTKPSNVLHYPDMTFRITDFGRSAKKDRAVYHDEFDVAGDRTYAPFELLYGSRHAEFSVRRFGCDFYMLGNLAAFMFSGVNVTANVFSRLKPDFHPNHWHGTYDQVLPYVQQAFADAIKELRAAIDADVRDELTAMIQQLCNPDLVQRGHPRGVGTPQQYLLQRHTSQLTSLCTRYELRHRMKKRTG